MKIIETRKHPKSVLDQNHYKNEIREKKSLLLQLKVEETQNLTNHVNETLNF